MVVQIEVVKKQYFALVAQAPAPRQPARESSIEAGEPQALGARHDARPLLAERIRTAYDTDRTSMLETFLSGGSFTDVISEVGYINDFAEQDKSLAEQIVEDQEALAAIHPTVESTRTQTDDLRVETREAEGGARQAARRAARRRRPGSRSSRARRPRRSRSRRPPTPSSSGTRRTSRKAIETTAAAQAALSAQDRRTSSSSSTSSATSRRVQRHAEVADGRQRDRRVRLQLVPGLRAGQRLRPLPQRHRHRVAGSGCGAPIKAAGDGRIGYVGWNYADGARSGLDRDHRPLAGPADVVRPHEAEHVPGRDPGRRRREGRPA